MHRLLALDLDGTMLDPNKVITSETRSSIQQLMADEVAVTIASGRFPASVWLHAREIPLNFTLVALNGAVTVDAKTGQMIEGFPLGTASLIYMLDVIEEEGAYVHFYGYNVLYVRQINDTNRNWALNNVVVRPELPWTEDHYKDQTELIRLVEVGSDFRTFVNSMPMPGMIYKAAVICTDLAVRERTYKRLEASGMLQCTKTGSLRFDVNAFGISKRDALERLCREQGIDRQEVAVAGDYDNDLDMLQWAGLGIAMGNAEPHVKAIANVITGTNEQNGVAMAIRNYLLK
ncbi:Cof-type HAD-IIB family hydrolase [Paenibacillus illinoisensis]|uniref:Cof-type HAD-IIB family hydrolase n=1 Tax=Paenibacillus illinoisensis TaxID=59845 RepID=UPI003D968381